MQTLFVQALFIRLFSGRGRMHLFEFLLDKDPCIIGLTPEVDSKLIIHIYASALGI